MRWPSGPISSRSSSQSSSESSSGSSFSRYWLRSTSARGIGAALTPPCVPLQGRCHADRVPDPFHTAVQRTRVLTAWAASPARFREDANAEEDLVRGGYRDRLVVELAQNAADAALRAGVPGRLRLELTGDL